MEARHDLATDAARRFLHGERLPVRRWQTNGPAACLLDARKLASDKGNAVLLLHGTVGSGQQFLQPAFADALFGAGEPLDAREHFIILPDAIGHGKSSKPSGGMGQDFPRYGYSDVVEAQHRLVTERLGLHRLRLVMGTSMGGMQTWMWGERYPDMTDALMSVASLPERVTGRNLLWRRLLLQVARLDGPGEVETPPRALGLASAAASE